MNEEDLKDDDVKILGIEPITESLLEDVLPNNLISVEGEVSLSERVAPFIADAEAWLESEMLGGFSPLLMNDKESAPAVRAVLLKAVIAAIPALDLVVTPTGFGVVSSSSIAPASKERVERLIASLTTSLDGALCSLFDKLSEDPLWREKDLPRELCSTFFRLRDALSWKSEGDIFDRFRTLRNAGKEVINALESRHLGLRLMRALKLEYHYNQHGDSVSIVAPIKNASVRYASALRQRPSFLPDESDIWHTAQAVIEWLPNFPMFYEEWHAEMGHTVDIKPFKNNRRGGYFF